MLEYVREGDVVYFESFSRISRSLPNLLNTLEYFSKKGVAFVSHKEQIDTSGATGKQIVSVLGAINAYEREINEERREFGFRNACKEGRVGRPKAQARISSIMRLRNGEKALSQPQRPLLSLKCLWLHSTD